MLVKPNERFFEDIAPNDVENDLYRKFHRVYSEILHPDNKTYKADIYCRTKNNIEDKIEQILNDASDRIVPVLGYIGMGKTFLMHYCIRKKYHYEEDIIKNTSFIAENDGYYDLIIYSSYDAARREERTKGRLGGKLSDAADKVLDWLHIPNKSKEDKEKIFAETTKYIESNKGELLGEYAQTPFDTMEERAAKLFYEDRIAYEAERLKWILTAKDTGIKNIVIVLDDIEGYIDNYE